jgi:hypothetical protein
MKLAIFQEWSGERGPISRQYPGWSLYPNLALCCSGCHQQEYPAKHRITLHNSGYLHYRRETYDIGHALQLLPQLFPPLRFWGRGQYDHCSVRLNGCARLRDRAVAVAKCPAFLEAGIRGAGVVFCDTVLVKDVIPILIDLDGSR